jgi:hypothetical protein
MSENKIINVPVDKARSKKKEKQQVDTTKSQQSELLKKGVPVTLFFIASLFLYTNTLVIKPEESRTIASDDFSRDIDWEHRLAKNLAEKTSLRGIASVGRSPMLQDELTAGLLHNKYRVQFNDGKITNIELTNAIAENTPTYVDSHQFLMSYKSLFPYEYNEAIRASSEKQETKIYETYNLLDDNEEVKGKAIFELDLHGRLLTMKVQSAS